MGNRHRNMYYATGQPGWMRFGYSPGWGELPPGAKYLSQTGQMPQFASWMQNQSSTERPVTPITQDIPAGSTREEEILALENQADLLSKQLKKIKKRLKEIGE